jgi:hypothetical protein
LRVIPGGAHQERKTHHPDKAQWPENSHDSGSPL